MIARTSISALVFSLILVMVARPTYGACYSIPVAGRWSSLRVGLKIPSTPAWAHDLVLNASRVWNAAQVWFQLNYFPDGRVYRFVESPAGNVTISFSIPSEFSSIAVGWTEYILTASSTILGAYVFLDGGVFNNAQEPNSTMRMYGLRVALHELGRVLGLGSLVDGRDIMDPIGTLARAAVPPVISIIDLFALHTLATEAAFSSPVIVLSTDQQVSLSALDLLDHPFANQAVVALDNRTVTCQVSSVKSPPCYA